MYPQIGPGEGSIRQNGTSGAPVVLDRRGSEALMLLFVDMDGALADFDRHHETVAGYRSDKLLDNADWAAVAAYERMEDMPVLSGSGSRDAYPSCLTSKDLRH